MEFKRKLIKHFLFPYMSSGSSCWSYIVLCAGYHVVHVRATSDACSSSMRGEAMTRFDIQSILEVTEAGVDVNCDRGTYRLGTNQPATLQCRNSTHLWQPCKSVLYILVWRGRDEKGGRRGRVRDSTGGGRGRRQRIGKGKGKR